jgi:hypothetical protein
VLPFHNRIAKHFSNEVGVITPNGKYLSGDPARGLKMWKELPQSERKTLEDLGSHDPNLTPTPPAGGLILNVYTRALAETGGRLENYQAKIAVARYLEAGRDHLWLTKEEATTLVPAAPRPGRCVRLPEAVTDRLCRFALLDLVRVGGNGAGRPPDHLHGKDLWLTVTSVADGMVRLRLEGTARLAPYDGGRLKLGLGGKEDLFQFLGYLTYKAGKGWTRCDLVAYSPTGHFDEVNGKVTGLGVAFELVQSDTPMDRFPPSCLAKDYFGKPRLPSFGN